MKLCSHLLLVLSASAQDVSWVRQFGSAGLDRGRGVYTDGKSSYVAGETTVAGPVSHLDAFVRKFDRQGQAEWARTFGTPGTDSAFAIAGYDDAVYVVGFVEGALPGQSSAGLLDAFVRKYDSSGQVAWTRQFGTPGNDSLLAVAADESGVYVGGLTTGAFPGQTNAGSTDAFAAKFSLSGQQQWISQWGTSAIEQVYAISPDKRGGVIAVGPTFGALVSSNSGSSDAYIRRLNSNTGATLWTRQFGTNAADVANAVAADRSGIYVGGSTAGALTGAGNAGGDDGFIRRFEHDGSLDWTRMIRTSANDEVRSLDLADGSLYVAGNTEGKLTSKPAAGLSDLFLRRYACGGDLDWTIQFGTGGTDSVRGLSVKGSRIVAAGLTDGQFPGQSAQGGADAFVVRVDQ